MASEIVIARLPPQDGREWDAQCARCGSSVEFEDCWYCGGEGFTAPGALYEEDPLWYDPEDSEPCRECRGNGGWLVCVSSGHGEDADSGPNWCEAHPMKGREETPCGAIEWFVVEREAIR